MVWMNVDLPSSSLILGGVRSGKSRYAEQLAQRGNMPVTFIATARANGDEAMRLRIEHHRATRPRHWHTIEEPMALSSCLATEARAGQTILVDCLTLWLTNLLLSNDESRCVSETAHLVDILPHLPGHLILVSNETGLGITPLGELTRRFSDDMGRLHQALAQQCASVVLMVAGLPLNLKGAS